MRSIGLVILSVLILTGAFFVYARVETGNHVSLDSNVVVVPPPPPPRNDGAAHSPFEEGQGAWMNSYDEKGELKDRFRGAEYKPQDSGVVLVQKPVAEFFMGSAGTATRSKQQMMRMIGTTGEVVMPQSTGPAGNSGINASSGTPKRGRIHNCRVDLFNLFPDSVPNVPDEQLWINNVQFDNETMLITSESFTEGDHEVPADQVPVKMRGKKYDFDGRGLRLRWNDKDGRLELLEVAHGEQLVVKDSSAMSGMMGPAGGKSAKSPLGPTARTSGPTAWETGLPLPEALVTTDRAAVRFALETPAINSPGPATKTKPPSPPVPYLATFYDNVRITQGPEVLVTADTMQVDFTTRKDSPMPATAPSQVGQKSGTAEAPMLPAMYREAASAPVTAATLKDSAVKPPATQPAQPPLVIRWTGKLVMVPAAPDRPRLLPGDAIINLTGSPCTVRRTLPAPQEGDDIKAARVVYHTADGSVKLINSEQSPMVVISKVVNGVIDPQTTITTQTLDYTTDSSGRKVAILTGPGHASVPIESKTDTQIKSKKPTDNRMDARWNQGARVYFASGKLQDTQTVEHVELAGNVDVQHPQLVMQSQALSLFFELPTKSAAKPAGATSQPAGAKSGAQPELKRVVAKESVHCEVAGQNSKKQKIDCNELEMRTARTPDGKFYARTLDARGAVHAYDDDQDLRSNTVLLTLRPAAPRHLTTPRNAKPPSSAQVRPATDDSEAAAVELEKMIASENVQVINKEGSRATGSQLTITSSDGGNHVRLTGSPSASVIDAKKNVVTGPVITFDPKEGIACVIGRGNMHVLQDQADGAKARPMDIAWSDRADMNGPGNRIDVLGEVIVKTFDSDGAVNTATGDRVTIDLMKKPAPATRPATIPSTRPAKETPAAAVQMDVMKDKEVRTITLTGHAKVKSVLTAANGVVSRQFVIIAPTVIYQMADSEELPAKTLWVPSAGQMFMGDHRAPEKPKAGAKKRDDEEAGGRGDTAFKWERMLVYKETEHKAVMTGDVVIVHQPEGKESADGPVRINADSVTAWFESKKPAKSTTEPATQTASSKQPDSALQLNHLTADGHITVTRGQTTLTADQIEYDPSTHWMTAHGTPDNLAHYETAEPGSAKSFENLAWNTMTWNVKATGPRIVNPR